MERNWLWNAISVGRYAWNVEIAAHLLEPIQGRDWLVRIPSGYDYGLYSIVLHPTNVWIEPYRIATVPATGFPYGYAVDQTRLP